MARANLSTEQIRSSLRASTLDGIFATLFSTITGGVLISNFLVELEASPLQIGLLASIPLLANLLQPLGAYLAERTTSRRRYSFWVYSISRLLWLPLAAAILLSSGHPSRLLIYASLAVMLLTHLIGAIGSASWLAWLAALVPRQLRGRYFGLRNSACSLTGLVSLPLLGVTLSHWPRGSIQGFGVMVGIGVVAGLISLGFQAQMADVNPQDGQVAVAKLQRIAPPIARTDGELPEQTETAAAAEQEDSQVLTTGMLRGNELAGQPAEKSAEKPAEKPAENLAEKPAKQPGKKPAGQDQIPRFRFLLFLLYFGLWAFGVNLSNPFFNLYLLDNLALDLNWVTLYNSLGAGANLAMMMLWGRLADRIGNRLILLLDGLVVAVVPLLWLGTDDNSVSLWLWFPLLHLLGGGSGAAIDLCINNLQLAIVPPQNSARYFAVTAALGGLAGALGTLTGGWLAQLPQMGQFTDQFMGEFIGEFIGEFTGQFTNQFTSLFALSSLLRLVALLPLLWLREPQREDLFRGGLAQFWLQFWLRLRLRLRPPVQAGDASSQTAEAVAPPLTTSLTPPQKPD